MISNLSNAYAPVASSGFSLPLDAEINVITADADKGFGTWLYRFGTNEATGGQAIQLKVPGKTVKYAKKYQTTVTWTLKDVP